MSFSNKTPLPQTVDPRPSETFEHWLHWDEDEPTATNARRYLEATWDKQSREFVGHQAILAMHEGNWEAAEVFLDAGGDPYVRFCKDMYTGLHLAAVRAGGLALLRRLIDAGLDLEASDLVMLRPSMLTPLKKAITAKQDKAARMLIEAGADPLQANHEDTSPLEAAVATQQLELAQFIVDRISPDQLDAQMVRAVQRPHIPLVKMLIEAGANLDHQHEGQSLMDLAASQPEVQRLLRSLEMGRAIEAAMSMDDDTPPSKPKDFSNVL